MTQNYWICEKGISSQRGLSPWLHAHEATMLCYLATTTTINSYHLKFYQNPIKIDNWDIPSRIAIKNNNFFSLRIALYKSWACLVENSCYRLKLTGKQIVSLCCTEYSLAIKVMKNSLWATLQISGQYYENYNLVITPSYRSKEVSVEGIHRNVLSSVQRHWYDVINFIILATWLHWYHWIHLF